MDDSSQGSRRTYSSRPRSSASNNTKMTSTSSNGSANLPPTRSQGSSLLQERLRERKTESARHSRRMSVEMDSERTVQSSPAVKGNREERGPSSSHISKALGVKHIEEQVSTLHKQNFDLKLELYHRRQRQETLEARLEQLEKQLEEQSELQEVNDQLLAELEKRDQAVEEAVGIIVTLENKVETLEENVESLMRDREHVRLIDAEYQTRYHQEDHVDIPSSPPELPKKAAAKPRLPKMPSFLSEKSEGAEALRSLYLPHNRSYSEVTLPKLQEEESTADGMNSPRLSVLSESSFVSVYGEKAPARSQSPVETTRHRRSTSAVEKWVDERPLPEVTPPRQSLAKNQYRSISDVMESPLQRLEKLESTLMKHQKSLVISQHSSVQDKRKSNDLSRVFINTASFDNQQGLPPTPDTISTGTLRHYQNSDDALRMKNGTFLVSTSTFQVPSATHNAYQSAISIRPRSAGETITSRRDGHGWDTETQDDITTDAASISSQLSSIHNYNRPRRIETPNLFVFGGADEWGRDIAYGARAPSRITSSRWDELRRSSLVERDNEPLSDDTIMPTPQNALTRYHDQIPQKQQSDVPDRRSSLAAPTKLRKAGPSNGSGSTQSADTSPTKETQDSPEKTEANNNKKSKLSALRIFKRSDKSSDKPEPSPELRAAFPKSATQAHFNHSRALGTATASSRHFDDVYAYEDEARATPPPIRRNRTAQNVVAYRPSSAGGERERRGSLVDEEKMGHARVRRGSVVVGGVREVEEERGGEGEKNAGHGGGRKWFGMGRNGSMRRNN